MNATPPDADTTTDAARLAYEARDWERASALLREADATRGLAPEELERLADAERWHGRPQGVVEALERAFAGYQAADARRAAARVALALCMANSDAGQMSIAAGWWMRGGELLTELPECTEHAFHRWLEGRAHGDRGDLDAYEQGARAAYDLARRVGNTGVEALALVDLGHVATARGRSAEAVRLTGQALAMAVTGELPTQATGLVYCQAVANCRCQGEWGRAGEWTETIARWIDREQVGYFPGLCRVHRAEVARHRGSLDEAEAEAAEAVRLLGSNIPRWLGFAQAELGEVRRRRGDLAGALEAFRAAIERGWDPQPGLALLVLEQGDAVEAHRAMERFFTTDVVAWATLDRGNLLRARVTTAVAAGELDRAELALEELGAQADSSGTRWDRAAHHLAFAELALARGEPARAAECLREAKRVYAEEDAPYEMATACAALGRALRESGDAFTARLELEAAVGIFRRIGACTEAERAAAWLDDGDAPAEPVASAQGADLPTDGRFLLEGDAWTLALGDAELRLKDGRGPRYIAELLRRPDEELLASDLVAAVAGEGADPAAPSDAGELIDDSARRAYEARVRELREQVAEAEDRGAVEAAEAAREELEAIARELSRAVGLGGRARRAGSSNERARQSVTKAIRATIRRVEELDPELGRLLETTLRTGTFCCYEPDPRHPVDWRL